MCLLSLFNGPKKFNIPVLKNSLILKPTVRFVMSRTSTDTRRHILNTALRLFLEKGFKEVSYTDLVGRTGLSKGAIYHHFHSKEELLTGVIEMLLNVAEQTDYAALLPRIRTVADFRKTILELKETQMRAVLDMVGDTHIKLNKFLFLTEAINESADLTEKVSQLVRHEQGFFEDCFRQLAAQKWNGAEKPPEKLASVCYWMMQGVEIKIIFMADGVPGPGMLEAYAKGLDDFFSII
jgi:AcrR family transcriptional regulator